MKHLKLKRRFLMIFLHGSPHPIGMTRHRQQRLAESSQLIVTEILRPMLWQQLRQPENFGTQLVSQPGQKSLIQQQTTELSPPETG